LPYPKHPSSYPSYSIASTRWHWSNKPMWTPSTDTHQAASHQAWRELRMIFNSDKYISALYSIKR
jgi:hypothetical protein